MRPSRVLESYLYLLLTFNVNLWQLLSLVLMKSKLNDVFLYRDNGSVMVSLLKNEIDLIHYISLLINYVDIPSKFLVSPLSLF